MSTKFKKYSNLTSLDRRTILKIYNTKTSTKKDMDITYSELRTILRHLFKEMRSTIIESVGGLLLSGIGYIGVWKSLKSTRKKGILPDKTKKAMNFHSDGYVYSPTLMVDVYDNSFLTEWSLDRAFNKEFKSQLKDSIIKGTKYRFNYSVVKGIFNNKIRENEI